jgi:hypothetical protein
MAAKTYTRTEYTMTRNADGTWTDVKTTVQAHVITEGSHCQMCGRITRGDEGYTSCCNERVVDAGSCDKYDDCYHA